MPAVNEPIHAPELQGGAWLNSAPLSLAALRGQAVLVTFWDYACVNCLRTLPYLTAWRRRYAEFGFTLISVHSPEFPFSRNEANVRAAMQRLGVEFPVLLDCDHLIWKAWANRFWPTHYLIGPDGLIRYFHYGEGDYLGIEAQIQITLRHMKPDSILPPLLTPLRASDEPGVIWRPATPDIYLGIGRERLGNPEEGQFNEVTTYTEHEPRMPNALYATGSWAHTADSLRLAGESGMLTVRYHGKDVYAVMSPPSDDEGIVEVEQDGVPLPQDARGADIYPDDEPALAFVDFPRAYHLVSNPTFSTHELCLYARTPGLEICVVDFIPDAAEESEAEKAA